MVNRSLKYCRSRPAVKWRAASGRRCVPRGVVGVNLRLPMLLSSQVLEAITRGTIQLAFRRWLRPSVRAGGTLLTARGQLEIGAVERVSPEQIGEADAVRAGYASRALLLTELNRRDAGDLYRIELGALRPDPRQALRASPATDPAEIERLLGRLRRLDAASSAGPWTRRTLELI